MRKFFKNWVIHNLLYKVIALIAAAIIWVLFMNSNDPIKSFSTYVNVEVLHQDEFTENGRYLEIEGSDDFSTLRTEVFMRARSSVIDSLGSRTAASFVRAYVDLYELSEDTNRLIIHYELKDSSLQAELYSIRNKTYLEVDVEESVAKNVPVVFRISGNPSDGYTYFKEDPDIKVTPSTIDLTGPASQMENIDHALITVSVADASANVNKSGALLIVDSTGRQFEYDEEVVYASATEASVFVPIYKYKTVSVLPCLSGMAPSGYEYIGDVAADEPSVQIYGPEAVVNTIQSIPLPEIDISAVTGEYSTVFQLQDVIDENFGEGSIFLMDDSPKEVTVTFTVAEQVIVYETVKTKDITIYGLPENMELSFADDSVDITLFGLSDAIEAFDPKGMSVLLRLSSLNNKPGTYMAALEVNGLGGLQYRAVSVSITLTEKEVPEKADEQTGAGH